MKNPQEMNKTLNRKLRYFFNKIYYYKFVSFIIYIKMHFKVSLIVKASTTLIDFLNEISLICCAVLIIIVRSY